MSLRDLVNQSETALKRQLLFCIILFIALVAVCPSQSNPQIEALPDGVVPPPLVFVSDDEAKQLKLEKKIKDRTKLSLALMETRIARAEKLSNAEDYRESLNQLAHFEALMKDALKYLEQNENNKGILKNFKKLEIGLREFRPRLIVLSRDYPFSHSYHVGKLIEAVKNIRGKAIDQFYGDTVIQDGDRR